MSEVSMLDRLLEDKKRGARIAYICDHKTQYRMLSLDGIIDALTLATNAALRAENAALRAEIARLRAENAALRAAVERVRALHTPVPSHVALIDVFGCSECSDDGRYSHYPCPTLRALEGMP